MPVSKERLYVNADKSKVVPEDSPEAAFLLVGQGGELTNEQVKQYGLKKSQLVGPGGEDEPEEATAEEPKADESEAKAVAEADNKAVEEPPANKARHRAQAKD